MVRGDATMVVPPSNISLLGPVAASASTDLRRTLGRCHSAFGVYKRIFEDAGVSGDDILNKDPLAVLGQLPLLDASALEPLADESLRVGSRIIDMETSSGTTGGRKRRFISYADDILETEFLAELFKVCGISRPDRVACLDTDPLTLMISFTKALDQLGVEEAYCYCAGTDFDESLEALPKLDPSVLITVPSVIERCFPALARRYASMESPRLRAAVYVGEPLADHTRAALESTFGVEVFGYYGASETSALGIECSAHDGVHLFTDRNLIEMLPDVPGGSTGEIVVTTLRLGTMPLLRYPLGDVIELRPGACLCGLEFPRVEIKGRAGDSVSILGSKIDYSGVLRAVFDGAGSAGFMQLVLERQDRELLTVVVSEAFKSREAEMREALLGSQPDLDFLEGGGFLDLKFRFVDGGFFGASRKVAKIVDRRGSAVGVPDMAP